MKKNLTVETKRELLKYELAKLDMIESLTNWLNDRVNDHCIARVSRPSWTEDYTDAETGEIKTRYHWTEYEKDENGDTVYDEPTRDDWHWEEWNNWNRFRFEIMESLGF